MLAVEPKRPAATIAYSLVTGARYCCMRIRVALSHRCVASAVAAPGGIPPRTTSIVAVVASCLAVLWLTAALFNGRPRHIARAVRRLSEDAARAKVLPDTGVSQLAPRARQTRHSAGTIGVRGRFPGRRTCGGSRLPAMW